MKGDSSMTFRITLLAIIGIIQSVLGVLAIIFAYIITYHDHFGVQTIIGVSRENMPLYMLLLLIFGIFSIISGFLLIHEWRKLRSEPPVWL